MITYGVTLYPRPDVTEQEMDGLLANIQSLTGVLPGLIGVEIHPAVGAPDRSRSYTLTFDSEAHLQVYNTHPAYQPIRVELHHLCPRASVSSIHIKSRSLLIETDGRT
jgi:hypothetical protein